MGSGSVYTAFYESFVISALLHMLHAGTSLYCQVQEPNNSDITLRLLSLCNTQWSLSYAPGHGFALCYSTPGPPGLATH